MKKIAEGTKFWGKYEEDGGVYWALFDRGNLTDDQAERWVEDNMDCAAWYSGPGLYFENKAYTVIQGRRVLVKKRFGHDI